MPSGVTDDHLRELTWRNYSPDTVYQRERVLIRLGKFGVDVVDATTDDLRAFLARPTPSGQRRRPSTATTELGHLASFYRWMVLEGFRDDDPTTRIVRPKLPRWLPHPIAEDDLKRALFEARPRVQPWLYLAAFAGLRACEIAPLAAGDLQWRPDPLIVVQRGKGGDPRQVPMAPALEAVMRTLPRRGWLFPRCDEKPGHTPKHKVSQLANAYLHRVGITETLHSLRHRFGTQFYRASGRDLRLTQETMGHRSIISTTVYTLVDQSEAAGVVGAMPLAGGGAGDGLARRLGRLQALVPLLVSALTLTA